MAATDDRKDPYAAFNFVVEIGGAVAGFSECSGLTTETDPIEYRNGDDPLHVRKIPGLHKSSNIVLKRGYTTDTELWKWRQAVIQGTHDRRDGSIALQDETGDKVVLRWLFRAGWPRKWEGPTFNAKNNEVAIETLEIACEEILLDE
jgi:phage tail-like protein